MSNPEAAIESPKWQWTLKDLLRWMAYLAIFSAMVSYLGMQNPLFWICMIFALVQTTTFAISVPRRNGIAPGFVIAMGIFFLANPMLMFISIATLINCVLHGIFLIVVKTRNLYLSTQRVVEVSVAITLVAFGIGICFGISDYAGLLQARKEYAPQDLTERLAYEDRVEAVKLPSLSAEQLHNSQWAALEREMSHRLEFRDSPVGRQAALHGLHQEHVEAFVKSPGFGIGRFFVPTPNRAKLPAIVDIAFHRQHDRAPLKYSRYLHNPWPIDSGHDLGDFHFRGTSDFFQPATFGIMLEPKVTRGFQPHAYHYQPSFEGADDTEAPGLSLERLQLISLRRFDTPRAYELDHLPRMDQLSSDDVPTRELTGFELDALKQIRNSQDVVVERGESVIEMAGSIRAIDACIQCHSADRGDLLGVFSYRFKTHSTH